MIVKIMFNRRQHLFVSNIKPNKKIGWIIYEGTCPNKSPPAVTSLLITSSLSTASLHDLNVDESLNHVLRGLQNPFIQCLDALLIGSWKEDQNPFSRVCQGDL